MGQNLCLSAPSKVTDTGPQWSLAQELYTNPKDSEGKGRVWKVAKLKTPGMKKQHQAAIICDTPGKQLLE